MTNSYYKQVILNLIWGVIGGFLSYLVNFLLTPYITNRVVIEAYGFVSLGNTLIAYVNIIAIGLNSFTARYVAIHYHNKEYDEANSVYSSVIIANIILSFVVMAICVPLIYELDEFLEIPNELILDVKLLFLFVLFNYLVNLFIGVINTVAFINNKIRITSRIKAFASIVYTFSILFLFNIEDVNIVYIGVATLIASVVCLGLIYISSLRLDDKIRFSINMWSVKKIKKVINAGIFNSINSLGGTLGSGLDLLITNRYLNVVTMGQIAVGNQLGLLFTMAVSLVSNVFQPKQLEAYSQRDYSGLVSQLKLSMKICGLLGISFLVIFIAIGYDFLALWIPNQEIERIYYIVIIIFLGDAIVSIITPLYYVSTLTVKMKPVCVTTLVCGIMNVLAMMLFIPYNLEWGACIVVGTTSTLNLVLLVLFPILSKKQLALLDNPFWGIIAKFIFIMISFSLLALFFADAVHYYDWYHMILYSIVVEVIIILGYGCVMFANSDFKNLVMIVRNKLNRNC